MSSYVEITYLCFFNRAVQKNPATNGRRVFDQAYGWQVDVIDITSASWLVFGVDKPFNRLIYLVYLVNSAITIEIIPVITVPAVPTMTLTKLF